MVFKYECQVFSDLKEKEYTNFNKKNEIIKQFKKNARKKLL